MYHSRRKGQMFTTDLIASSIIFLVIVNISLLAWNTSYENRTALNQDRVVKNRVVRVTDLLIRSPGHPDDWTSSNVDIIGLAKKGKDHFLDNGKAVELKDMKYSDQRDAIRADRNDFYLEITVDEETAKIKSSKAGIGDDPVAFIPEEGDSIGNLKLLEVLNSSSVAWDLYWPSDNSQQSLPGLTARKVYNYTEDGKAMFDDMLVNASNGEYNSVISEGSNLDTGDIQNEGQLESFVSDNGGTYVHVEEKPELIRDTFGLDEVSVGSGNGTVKETSALLNSSLDIGDNMIFEDEQMAFENVSTLFIEDTESPNGCLACKWNNGSGEIYYLADTFTETGENAGFTDADHAVGGTLPLEFGRYPDSADTVAVHNRRILVNTSNSGVERGTLKLVFWDD